jgi:[acyl-carrier-protein] S-malonyltransferase
MMNYKKITLVFPGQGSQYVGMGLEFFEKFDFVRDLFDQGSQILGYDIPDLCFKKHTLGKILHKPDLDRTIYTQPMVLTVSYACFLVLKEECRRRNIDLEISFLAGHSLGEYTALLAAGAMDFETTLDLVNKRATFITEFSKAYPDAGLMALVDKSSDLDKGKIEALCNDFQVHISIINSRKQIVIGGFKKNLDKLAKHLSEQGIRGMELRVEGPFHTPLMQQAADRFNRELDGCRIRIASRPVLVNVSSEALVDPGHIKNELYKQIFSPVDWRQSIEKIIRNGGDLFIEVGPKTVLSNIIRDVDPAVPRLNVENTESLEKTLKELESPEA